MSINLYKVGWKIIVAVVRVKMIIELVRSFIKHHKVEEKVENKVQWMEAFASLDVVWSAIPLGILTALEMFYFSEKIHFTISSTIEMVKLIALAIDMVGLSYFVYFEIFGLEHKFYGHHHDEHKSINSHSQKEPLLSHT
jgi:hypothetical protein